MEQAIGVFAESEEDDEEEINEAESEEQLLKHYFYSGYKYNEILLFLEKHHDIAISYSTLLRRLQTYGLQRRSNRDAEQYAAKVLQARERMQAIVDGPGGLSGYRSIWHRLEIEGLRIPRSIVQTILKDIDPRGTALRRRHRLHRREYKSPGPNFAWHIDGYDKLKPWGFPIHGSIDGYSRKVLWLELTRSNKSPDNIATMYLKTVQEQGGSPVELVTDLGTENCIAAAIQCYLRDSIDAHRYVPSPRNQRIEGWWSFFSKHYSTWWINFFSDLEFRGIVDLTMELSKECLWYCFSPLIQRDLDNIKLNWNTHTIRRSRYNTVAGRPNSLYHLPELHGGENNLLLPVAGRQIAYVEHHIIDNQEINDFKDYFNMIMNMLNNSQPGTWQEALSLYDALMRVADRNYPYSGVH